MRYVVLDSTNHVVNVIVWDGVTEYNPGDGFTLIRSDTAEIGEVYIPDHEAFV
jgi:hypothetical protein